MPLSEISTTTKSASAIPVTCMRPRSGVYLMALSIRLETARSM